MSFYVPIAPSQLKTFKNCVTDEEGCVSGGSRNALGIMSFWKRVSAPYSPDLAPPDFHLFWSISRGLFEQNLNAFEEVDILVNKWISSKGAVIY